MEAFSALLAFCAGNSPVNGEYPSHRPVTRGFDVLFDLRLNQQLSKQWRRGDLRRHRADYDVTVMEYVFLSMKNTISLCNSTINHVFFSQCKI